MVRLNPRSLRVLNQDGAPDAMQSVEGADHVGAFLREARETTGRTVADVAQTLRIRRVYLEAIEDGRFDELPGSAYAVGFIRSYATYLRLDVPAVVARFKDEASGIEAPLELDFPTPVPEGRFPGGTIVTLCLLIAAAGAGGWYWWQSQKNIEIARVPPPPEVLTGASDTPVEISEAAPVTEAAPPAEADATVTENEAVETDPADRVSVGTRPAETAAAEPLGTTPAREELPVEDMRVAEPVVPTESEESSPPGADTEIPEDGTADVAETEAAPEQGIAAVPPSYVRPAVDPIASAADLPDQAPQEPAVPETAPAPADEPAEDVGAAQASSPPVAEVGESGDAAPVTEISGLPAIPEPSTDAPDDADGRTYGSINRNARIVLSALEANTWVQVMDSQENALLTQMLRPGDKYLVPNRPGLSLRTNNAGGLEIAVDGAPVPAIGGSGDIRREVRLDPESLKAGTAVIQ